MQFQFSDNDFGSEDALKNYFTPGLMDSYFHSLTLGYTGTMCAGPFRIPKRRERPLVNNAARERSRVKTLRTAFKDLQQRLPAVPPDTKLSKLDVLMLATSYIARLMSALQEDGDGSQIFTVNECMHPVKKWPMRTRLYGGMLSNTTLNLRDHEDGFVAQTTYVRSQEEVYIAQNGTPQP